MNPAIDPNEFIFLCPSWVELADVESMRVAIPVDLNKTKEWKFYFSVCSVCLHRNFVGVTNFLISIVIDY